MTSKQKILFVLVLCATITPALASNRPYNVKPMTCEGKISNIKAAVPSSAHYIRLVSNTALSNDKRGSTIAVTTTKIRYASSPQGLAVADEGVADLGGNSLSITGINVTSPDRRLDLYVDSESNDFQQKLHGTYRPKSTVSNYFYNLKCNSTVVYYK